MSGRAEVNGDWSLRRAVPDDAAEIARHRVAMFREMGQLLEVAEDEMRSATERHVREAIARGEYVGWLAHEAGRPERVVAGAGVQRRPLLPRPSEDHSRVLVGTEGLVLNVWVEPDWRRRGIAEAMMREILAWAPGQGIVRVSLHASSAGRPLYERLGFVASSEMRFPG